MLLRLALAQVELVKQSKKTGIKLHHPRSWIADEEPAEVLQSIRKSIEEVMADPKEKDLLDEASDYFYNYKLQH